MPLGAHAVCPGAGTRAEFSGRVVPAGRRRQRGKTASFCYQEAIGGDTQRGVVMKSSPTAAFIVP